MEDRGDDGISDNERLVVYSDSTYPSSWIPKSRLAQEIANWLEREGFVKKNAEGLKVWIQRIISAKVVLGTVVVFSQDVVPSTIMRDATSNNLIRKYLDLGGAIVWLGDIPFFYGGLKDKELKDSLPFWDMGSYSILGLTFARASSSVRIKLAWRSKLRTLFYSQRPLRLTIARLVLFWLSHMRLRPLAYTKLYRPPEARDLAPQRLVREEEKRTLMTTVGRLARGLETLRPLGLFFFLLLFFLGVLAVGQLPGIISSILSWALDETILTLLVLVSLASSIGSIYAIFFHEFYVSSWLMTFGPKKGQILRLWDCAFPEWAKLSKGMKRELLDAMRAFVTKP